MKQFKLCWLVCILLTVISLPASSQLNSSLRASITTALQGRATRNVRMLFESAGGSGSSPLERVNITVLAGNRTLTQRTSNDGIVLFNNIPCGQPITVSVPDSSIATSLEKPVGRTFPLTCGGGTLSLSFFTCEDGRLHNGNSLPSLDTSLSGITTERLQFRRRESSTEVRRAIAGQRIINFLVGARRGQRITIHISSAGDEVRCDLNLRRNRDVFIPRADGNTSGCGESTENVTDFAGILPENGDYIISVYPTRGATNFSLEVAIE